MFRYADEIFTIGAELANVVRGQYAGGPITFNVGVVSSMPKLVAERIIAPAFDSDEPLKIRCAEESLQSLLGDLATHRLDLVLSDQPMPQGLSLKAYNHRLGESGLSFFASRSRARKLKNGFPLSLNDQPMLVPARNSALRRRLENWFDDKRIVPQIVGEFDDSALLKAFGEAGVGVFAGPTAIEKEICTMYRAAVVGRSTTIVERYYAISVERRLKHPAVVLITELARTDLFTGNTATV